ncbi:MAG TPA: D-tyrosyl-tRNA(Tyr) deacylase [Candidatus Cloacimonetes bacterium]|nr:D-tyrosyl-tRNA(Tyr) deacylase [Candidatus Cloacimonadota bacterium]
MRLLIQRVNRASVIVEGSCISEISKGLLIFIGVGLDDTEIHAEYLAKKAVNLRIFEDDEGKMNLSVKDIGGEILLISQFTLYADTKKGNRPGFSDSAPPEKAEALYEYFGKCLNELGVPIKMGQFGELMEIDLLNFGPATFLLERE